MALEDLDKSLGGKTVLNSSDREAELSLAWVCFGERFSIESWVAVPLIISSGEGLTEGDCKIWLVFNRNSGAKLVLGNGLEGVEE